MITNSLDGSYVSLRNKSDKPVALTGFVLTRMLEDDETSILADYHFEDGFVFHAWLNVNVRLHKFANRVL